MEPAGDGSRPPLNGEPVRELTDGRRSRIRGPGGRILAGAALLAGSAAVGIPAWQSILAETGESRLVEINWGSGDPSITGAPAVSDPSPRPMPLPTRATDGAHGEPEPFTPASDTPLEALENAVSKLDALSSMLGATQSLFRGQQNPQELVAAARSEIRHAQSQIAASVVTVPGTPGDPSDLPTAALGLAGGVVGLLTAVTGLPGALADLREFRRKRSSRPFARR